MQSKTITAGIVSINSNIPNPGVHGPDGLIVSSMNIAPITIM